MYRFAIWLAATLLLGTAIAWMADHPGAVVVDWQGWRIETTLAVLAGLFALFILAFMLLFRLWNWARRDLPFVGANRHLRRQRRGLEALNSAVIALAAGKGKDAFRLVERAQRLLPPQPMTHVIAAQAAQLNGDTDRVRQEYEMLRAGDATAFIGVRGLLGQAMSEGRKGEALHLVEQAVEQEPKSPWALKLYYELLVSSAKWTKAMDILARVARAGGMDGDVVDRHKAVLHFVMAKEVSLAGDTPAAQKHINAALKLWPAFEAASIMGARLAHKAGDKTKAGHILTAAWKAGASTPILDLYEEYGTDLAPAARRKRMEKFIGKAPALVSAQFTLARYAVAAGDYKAARAILAPHIAKGGPADALSMMAELLRAEGRDKGGQAQMENEKEAAKMDAQAKSHPRPQSPARFLCNDCGAPAAEWHATCSACGAFAAIEQRSASVRAHPHKLPAGTPPLVILGDTAPPLL